MSPVGCALFVVVLLGAIITTFALPQPRNYERHGQELSGGNLSHIQLEVCNVALRKCFEQGGSTDMCLKAWHDCSLTVPWLKTVV